MSAPRDLSDVVVFARVVEAGSFTEAGAVLQMPKPTVSRKVTELESRLGARLLQRTTRKLHLTDVGRTYYAYCARIVSELEEAERAVGRLQGMPRGVLRVTTPVNFTFLGSIFSDFFRRYPEVVLDVVSTDRVVDLVEEGFDLAIRVGSLADSTLIARPIGSFNRIAVASSRYLEKRGRPRDPRDLMKHDALVFSAGATPTTWHLIAGAKTLDVVVKPRLLVNDANILLEAARTDLGVAMLPIYLLAEIRAQRLEHILKPWCSPPIVIHAVYPSTRHLSPKVKTFVDHLRDKFNPPPWELGPAP